MREAAAKAVLSVLVLAGVIFGINLVASPSASAAAPQLTWSSSHRCTFDIFGWMSVSWDVAHMSGESRVTAVRIAGSENINRVNVVVQRNGVTQVSEVFNYSPTKTGDWIQATPNAPWLLDNGGNTVAVGLRRNGRLVPLSCGTTFWFY
jgi:hypothetical protein